MDFLSPSTMLAIGLGLFTGSLVQLFHFKKKIEKIGQIKCDRCEYQGKPVQWGFHPKIVCPDYKSDRWKKMENA